MDKDFIKGMAGGVVICAILLGIIAFAASTLPSKPQPIPPTVVTTTDVTILVDDATCQVRRHNFASGEVVYTALGKVTNQPCTIVVK